MVRSEANRKPERPVKAWHTLETSVRVGGQDGVAHTIIREDTNGNFYYYLEKDEGTPELRQEVRGSVPSDDPSEIKPAVAAPSPSGPAVTTDHLTNDIAEKGSKFNLSLEQPSVTNRHGL